MLEKRRESSVQGFEVVPLLGTIRLERKYSVFRCFFFCCCFFFGGGGRGELFVVIVIC